MLKKNRKPMDGIIENCSVTIKRSGNDTQISPCEVQIDGTGLNLASGTVVLVHRNKEDDDEEEGRRDAAPLSSMLLSMHEQSCRTSTTPCLVLNPLRARIAHFAACTTATLEILPTPLPDSYTLDRVFLECTDRETWEGRSEIPSLCGHVVCQGTTAHKALALHTLACDPYLQGVIGEKTKVVILPPHKRRITKNGYGSDAPSAQINVTREFIVKTSGEFIKPCDPHNVAVISDEAMRGLGIKQNSWVSLYCGGRSHIAQLSSIPLSSYDDDDGNANTVHVHPCLLFNMGIEEGSKVRVDELGTNLPVAQEVHLARVLSPESSGTENYAYELWKYFKTPRSVSVGDVIAVRSHAFASSLTQGLFESSDVSDDYCSPQDAPHQSKARSVLVYFSVTKVTASETSAPAASYLVDGDSTKLIQTGVVNSFIPLNSKEIINEPIITCNNIIALLTLIHILSIIMIHNNFIYLFVYYQRPKTIK